MAAEGHEADRTGAHATAGWTKVKPAPVKKSTFSRPGAGGSLCLLEGDSDQQTGAVGQAPRTPDPSPRPGREAEGA